MQRRRGKPLTPLKKPPRKEAPPAVTEIVEPEIVEPEIVERPLICSVEGCDLPCIESDDYDLCEAHAAESDALMIEAEEPPIRTFGERAFGFGAVGLPDLPREPRPVKKGRGSDWFDG